MTGKRTQAGIKRVVSLLLFTALFLVRIPTPDALEVHGKVMWNQASRINEKEDHPANLTAEEGLHLEFSSASEDGSSELFVKSDFWNDDVSKTGEVDLREAGIVFTTANLDVRAGRQVLTWGLGDRIYVSDVFPKDWEAFYTGRPLEYLKLPSTGVKADYYSDLADFEFVWFPVFTPDNLPSPVRFRLPGAKLDPPPVEARDNTPAESEFGLRAQKTSGGYALALHFYRGYWRQFDKGLKTIDGTETFFYPKLNVLSLTLQHELSGGILNMEGGYYDSADDRNEKDPLIENSQWRFLAGYEREVMTDLNAGLQYYAEILENRKDISPGIRDAVRHILTLSLRKLFLSQTGTLSLWAMFDAAKGDYFINPECKYNITDELRAAAGVNLFGGGTTRGFFGQLDKNDNLYFRLAWEF